jgi:hypothetical protein
MKFSISKFLVVALASTEVVVASTWFNKAGTGVPPANDLSSGS